MLDALNNHHPSFSETLTPSISVIFFFLLFCLSVIFFMISNFLLSSQSILISSVLNTLGISSTKSDSFFSLLSIISKTFIAAKKASSIPLFYVEYKM